MLEGKHILLGVTGSIAAYKAASLVRLLKKSGAEVQVVMTASASDFISALTLSTLSGKPALSDFVKDKTGVWNSHVELGLWADLMLIAPASAQTIAKMANGLCDNLLMATYLSARCPVMVCPAMDLDMYVHPATLRNLDALRTFGHLLVDAEDGELASGLVGKGRMAEPEHILEAVKLFFQPKYLPLQGKKALVTAGPTQEHIDPVRYLTNASTGKMGYAIAQQLHALGASVTIVSGPSQLPVPQGVGMQRVVSAQEMYEAVAQLHPSCDLAVFSAAVADYTPVQTYTEKVKKEDGDLQIGMKRTPDIAALMGKQKQPHQLHIGFALETNDEEKHAMGKLERKNFDLVVLNSLRHEGAGFGHDTNRVAFVTASGVEWQEMKSKHDVAKDICARMMALMA